MAPITISVADALGRLKIMSNRIDDATKQPFIAVRTAGRIPGFVSALAFETEARAAFQSVVALLANYATLKAALVESNATTTVTIGNQTMTVAAAIERKKSIVQDQALLAVFTVQLTQAQRSVDVQNTQVAQVADKQAIAFFGDKTEKTTAEYMQFVAHYIQQNGSQLIDPLDLKARIRVLADSTQTFLANVDLMLTTSNVRTEITIDL